MTERDPNRGAVPPEPGGVPPREPAEPRGSFEPATAGARTAPVDRAGEDPRAPRPAGHDADAPTVVWTRPTDGPVEEMIPPPREPVRRERRGNGARWAAALLVVALIVGAGIAAGVLLAGQTATSSVVGYAADDSVVYGELRLDFPGDQRQKLGQFLSKFPGFADQSTFDVKIDDVLDRVVRAATMDEQDWTTKIKPWFGGELGFSVGSLPPPDQPEAGRFLAMLSVTDPAKARAWFEEVAADASRSTTQHNGTDLTLLTPSSGGPSGAMAIAGDKVMLVGDEASVRAGIDTGGSGQFASSDRFKAALAEVDGDSLGYAFVDTASYLDWTNQLTESMGGEALPFTGMYEDLTPDWMLVRLQARGDALAFEGVSPHIDLGPGENRVGTLAQHVPPGTIALVDAHDYGQLLLDLVERFRAQPGTEEAFRQVDQAVGIVGGFDGLLGWMGDAGFAVARDEAGDVEGGLIFRPTERSRADTLLTTLRSFATIGGAQAGITVRDEDYNGTTIGIIDFGDWATLLGAAGAAGGMPPGMEMPEGRLEIAYATTDDIVVLGIGTGWVHSVLDAGAGESLADTERYRTHLERVGTENLMSSWLDITAIRELIETFGSTDPEAFASYERDIKPYLVPLDVLVAATVRDGEVDHGTSVITVK